MFFKPDFLAKSLNIKLSYLFKLLSSCGIRKMSCYRVNHLVLFKNELDHKYSNKKLLIMKLEDLIEEFKNELN